MDLIPIEQIIRKIYLIRNQKVMLDSDLAELYEVDVKILNQAVKRNIDRFPDDFMLQLTDFEYKNMRSQFVTASKRNARYNPYVFTEQGVAMLSSILRSKRAVQVNVQIIRSFIKLRELLATNKELKERIEAMEAKYDKKLKEVFDVLKQLIIQEEKPKKQIGFLKD